MPKLTSEMVDTINQRLAARGRPERVVKQAYENINYLASFIPEKRETTLSPFLVSSISYINCSSSDLTYTDKITKSVETTATWYIKAGLEIGMSVEAEAGVVFAKAKTTISAKLSLEGGYSETKKEAVQIETQLPLTVPSMTSANLQVVTQQEEVQDLPFVVKLILTNGAVLVTLNDEAPFYRYYNPDSGDHFYTRDFNELGEGRDGYTKEGIAGYILATQQPGTVPFYRYYSPDSGDHFYTTDYNELGEGRYGYTKEGIAGYIFNTQQPGTVPLHRYLNSDSGDHFYTTDYNELGEGRDGYTKEGIAGFIFAAARTMDIAQILPLDADRAFQISGTFKGKALVRETNILVKSTPMTKEQCAILTAPAAKESPLREKRKGLVIERVADEKLSQVPILSQSSKNAKKIINHPWLVVAKERPAKR
ncbi:MAG: hypothetical protein AB1489_31020 [Acidobacteriota bacterium]